MKESVSLFSLFAMVSGSCDSVGTGARRRRKAGTFLGTLYVSAVGRECRRVNAELRNLGVGAGVSCWENRALPGSQASATKQCANGQKSKIKAAMSMKTEGEPGKKVQSPDESGRKLEGHLSCPKKPAACKDPKARARRRRLSRASRCQVRGNKAAILLRIDDCREKTSKDEFI